MSSQCSYRKLYFLQNIFFIIENEQKLKFYYKFIQQFCFSNKNRLEFLFYYLVGVIIVLKYCSKNLTYFLGFYTDSKISIHLCTNMKCP